MNFNYMDEKEYEKLLEDLLFDGTDEDFASICRGHALTEHTEKTDADMVKRVLKEHKPVSSCCNREDFADLVRMALVDRKAEIAGWMTADKNDPMFSRQKGDYCRFMRSVKMGEIVGTGFDLNLREKQTESICFCLERTFDPNAKLGFYVTTAYPHIDHKLAYYTGKQYNLDQILKEEVIDKDDKLTKMYVALKTNPLFQRKDMSFQYKQDHTNSVLCITIRDREEKIHVFCEPDRISFKIRDELGDLRKIDRFSLCMNHESKIDILDAIENLYEEKLHVRSKSKNLER